MFPGLHSNTVLHRGQFFLSCRHIEIGLQLKTQACDEIKFPCIITRDVEVYFISNILQIYEYSYRISKLVFTIQVHYRITINGFR